ncbi:MAG: TatD family hydrolase [Chitinophagaceae bacterium]|nr:TatD family hydrolase [Chitinophagaceae bacterium]
MFINIHSHQPPAAQEWCIQNLYNDFDKADLPGNYSIGIHPWHLDAANWPQQMEALGIGAVTPCAGHWECGLDKVCITSFSLQQQVFSAQIQSASEVGKPSDNSLCTVMGRSAAFVEQQTGCRLSFMDLIKTRRFAT